MWVAIDLIEGLRYKLRMFGVPLSGPTRLFCDNDSVVKNTTAPEYMMKKKHNTICYHWTCEAQVGNWISIAKEPGQTNLADFITKSVPGKTLKRLAETVL
jgi:hypothetical protein